MDKTWNVKIYNISIETIFSRFCTPVILECLWRLPLGAKHCSQYNLESGFFDLNKTWR